ncbi:hypothetical protein [Nocardia sp. XZ_19_385]|uniref:hypothetical protein n=1 Tax=Nocardia sp. XZ_19_385 TaxID=2769488 RepID=UPI00188E9C6E|nr:hypothetical protein [Nocardia sp. XZ_19_385]
MTQPLLSEATVQEIQLDLIRRSSFNNFDGPRVVASLQRHRELWVAACIDRLNDWAENPGWLPDMSLIKLRDLDSDSWNVDTLFILTSSPDTAHEMARVVCEEQWYADRIKVHTDPEEICSALGSGERNYGLLSVWWD